MEIKKGKFIVIEGIDGSGKATQLQKLKEYLEDKNIKVSTFDFPQYSQPSSYFVREYLNGKYGHFKEVGPYRASIFFALDRYAAKSEIEIALSTGKVAISNRYVASNMAHQGSSIENSVERKKYFEWITNLEFNILGIPKPDLNVILHVDAVAGQVLVDKKNEREYIEDKKKRDIHEADIEHLKRTEKVYKEIAELFSGHFATIECMSNNGIMTPEEIHARILNEIKPLLN